jgi:hypothetical protein
MRELLKTSSYARALKVYNIEGFISGVPLLNFKQGDLFSVLERNKDNWYKCSHLTTNAVGVIHGENIRLLTTRDAKQVFLFL